MGYGPNEDSTSILRLSRFTGRHHTPTTTSMPVSGIIIISIVHRIVIGDHRVHVHLSEMWCTPCSSGDVWEDGNKFSILITLILSGSVGPWTKSFRPHYSRSLAFILMATHTVVLMLGLSYVLDGGANYQPYVIPRSVHVETQYSHAWVGWALSGIKVNGSKWQINNVIGCPKCLWPTTKRVPAWFHLIFPFYPFRSIHKSQCLPCGVGWRLIALGQIRRHHYHRSSRANYRFNRKHTANQPGAGSHSTQVELKVVIMLRNL